MNAILEMTKLKTHPEDTTPYPSAIKEQLIAEILNLSVQAQYRTGNCVFIEFYGHVHTLSIRVRESVRNSRRNWWR